MAAMVARSRRPRRAATTPMATSATARAATASRRGRRRDHGVQVGVGRGGRDGLVEPGTGEPRPPHHDLDHQTQPAAPPDEVGVTAAARPHDPAEVALPRPRELFDHGLGPEDHGQAHRPSDRRAPAPVPGRAAPGTHSEGQRGRAEHGDEHRVAEVRLHQQRADPHRPRQHRPVTARQGRRHDQEGEERQQEGVRLPDVEEQLAAHGELEADDHDADGEHRLDARHAAGDDDGERRGRHVDEHHAHGQPDPRAQQPHPGRQQVEVHGAGVVHVLAHRQRRRRPRPEQRMVRRAHVTGPDEQDPVVADGLPAVGEGPHGGHHDRHVHRQYQHRRQGAPGPRRRRRLGGLSGLALGARTRLAEVGRHGRVTLLPRPAGVPPAERPLGPRQ